MLDGYLGERKTFTHEGVDFEVTLQQDDRNNAPWEAEDGHGPVSDWTRNDKAAGEILLCHDGRRRRFYDFAETCKIARRDGWGFLPGKLVTKRLEDGSWEAKAGTFIGTGADHNAAISALYTAHRASMTARQYAAGAAMADFQRLKDWCDAKWSYCVVKVARCDDPDNAEYLGGVETDAGEYLEATAYELADQLLH